MTKNSTNFILILSIVIFISFTFVFVYLLNVIKNKNNHISAVIGTLEQKISDRENIGALEDRMIELKTTQNQIKSFLVDPGSIDTFVEYIENLGEENNVELSVTNVDIPKNEKNKILVIVHLKGDFEQVMRTINILENAPYNITFVSAYINKDIKADTPQTASTDKKVVKEPEKLFWQADITFNVLSIK